MTQKKQMTNPLGTDRISTLVARFAVPSIIAMPVSYTHLRAHETDSYLVCRLLLEKKKKHNHTTSFPQITKEKRQQQNPITKKYV